jgi:histone H3/H4
VTSVERSWQAAVMSDEIFKICNNCKKPIPYGSIWWACSVSTCNRGKTAMYFCSVDCVDSHAPVLRHRSYWAEERKAPTRAEALAEAEAEAAAEREKAQRAEASRRRVVELDSRGAAAIPREILVVASRLKSYVRERSGMNTSDAVMDKLSDHLRALVEVAIRNAAEDGRKTILDRDVPEV